MTVTTSQYGSYTHGEPYYSGRTWFRFDQWLSVGGEASFDRLFAASKSDDTPIYRGPYGFDCSCCYLGFAHTTAAHIVREPKCDATRDLEFEAAERRGL